MAFTLATVVCLATGFALVSLFSPLTVTGTSGFLFKLTLSSGFGLGIFSLVFFLTRVSAIPNIIAADVAASAFLVTALILARNTSASTNLPVFSAGADEHWPRWFRQVLVAANSIALCGALYAAIMQALAHPQGGGWDAFAIWNLRARFLFLGGSNWRNTSMIPWSHPDYPLLIPASIAHLWTFLNYDDPLIPAAVALLLTFASVGLLFLSLSMLRGRVAAMLASLTLLATPFFIEQGVWQYADIPLSFFFLATMALLAISDEQSLSGESRSSGFMALAGIAAGFAAWTKNEGILFLFATFLSRQIVFLRAGRKRDNSTASSSHHSAAFLLGCAPLILVIVYFKLWIAPPGDLFTSAGSMLHRLLEPARFETAIKKVFVHGLFTFGDWLGIPGTVLLLAFYFIAGRGDPARGLATGHRASVLALFLMFVGYFCVYLITPYNLFWHLRFSLDRLFLQLWPSAIFLFFLLIIPQTLSLSSVSK